MFTVATQKNLTDAKRYFREQLTRNDYYGQEIHPGQWIGIGADRLGLKVGGTVTADQFEALCENQHPETGNRLTLRLNGKDKRRVFYDFTCSAPKSLSVLAATLGDERLVRAHEAAVEVAFTEIESFAATRVRKQGNQIDRKTGNLIAARFTHTASRALDPQLHTHCVVFNATFDQPESAWKALQAGVMYEAIRYGTEVYRNELARRVHSLGYKTLPATHGFEIEGVSQEVLQRFSKRTQKRKEIVRGWEEKLGRKLSNSEIARVVRQSRERKLTKITTQEVREHQLAQLSGDELAALRSVQESATGSHRQPRFHREREAIDHAIAHVFERRSVVPQHELLQTALAYRHGELQLPRLKTALQESETLVPTENGYSTREILSTELELIAAVNGGKDAVQPLNPSYRPGRWLSDDQRTALRQLFQSPDRITGIRGLAGSGKTTTLKELKAGCAGYSVQFCAPTAAATEVLRQEGFDAVTLATLLHSPPEDSGNTIVVLDEAGAVGIDDMRRLFELTKNHRLILSGDTGQHPSVARGDALRILEDHSDFEFGQLTRIRRQQRADYRQAVELAAKGQTTAALHQLEQMGAISEHSGDELYAAAAQRYLSIRDKGKTALLVAPTWAEIDELTENVRSELKARGQLTGNEQEFRVFDSLSWTEAQKRDSRHYRPRLAVSFHLTMGAFTRNETAEVDRVSDEVAHLRRQDGTVSAFKLSNGGFDVGEWRTLKIAPGDRLLLQANTKQFINGELVHVKEIVAGNLVLTDGRTIPSHYRTFTHGYAVTSHAAQGKTVDEVLVVASSRSLPGVHREQFYVSISRGRQHCHFFTDDVDLLRLRVSHSSVRPAAVEAVGHSKPRRSLSRRLLDWAEQFRRLLRTGLRQSALPRQPSPKTWRKRLSHHYGYRESHSIRI